MIWRLLISLVLFLTISSNAFSKNAPIKTVENRLYRVAWVIDGDTIKLENAVNVRLIGIDAPENRDDAKLQKDLKRRHLTKAQELEMGKKSARFLRDMISGKKVSLKFDKEKYDQYHRMLAYVYLPNGTFVNAKMVKDGYAYYYEDKRKVDIRHLVLFKKLYKEARENHRGLWKNGGKDEKHLKWFSHN
jgi:micrococcal nuclease